jgi:hypothetical protein
VPTTGEKRRKSSNGLILNDLFRIAEDKLGHFSPSKYTFM